MALAEMMEEERNRLQAKLEDIARRRVELDQEENAVTIEMQALTAYFDTKLGKVTARQVTNTKPRKPRGPRQAVSVKAHVLATVQEHPTGISKQDILVALNATENKSLQNGISNALVQLKKAGTVVSGERGMYKLPDTPPTELAEPKAKRVKKLEAWPQ